MKIKANKNLRKLSPKKFILDHLIPFILRDAGRGFAMDTWETKLDEDSEVFDGLDNIWNRKAPACGTAACIGGSIQCLTGLKGGNRLLSHGGMAKLLGIKRHQATGLFYDWGPNEGGWPEKYATRFDEANTPYKKARVACSLLRQIAKKGSAALPDGENE